MTVVTSSRLLNETLMESSGLNVFDNFQYRLALQKDGSEILKKIPAQDLACASNAGYTTATEEFGGYESKDFGTLLE